MARYEHDCLNCVFLGEYFEYDLYFCDHGGSSKTVIARYGNEGHEYQSGLYPNSLHFLEEAKRRSIEKGLI